MIKVLNLYSGLGGNRRLWYNCDVTAVELDKELCKIYKNIYKNDIVLQENAHEYLLNNYKNFDFIWSSPPCQTHSRARFARFGKEKPIYPDMSLYQEIIFLQTTAKNIPFIVENVIPYYKPLIKPNYKIGRHFIWTNINLNMGTEDFVQLEKFVMQDAQKKDLERINDIDVSEYKGEKRKVQILRNMVDKNLGLFLYEQFLKTLN